MTSDGRERMRVCAITNVLDEHFNLPLWLNYYGRELGPENCVIVDRGSVSLPALTTQSVIQTHRHPLDDAKRARTISSLTNTLLDYYDVVLYTDCDEMLVPDPALYSGLIDYFSRTDAPAYSAAGIDVVHKLDVEDPIDLSRPLLSQRSYGVFNSWLCKTLATRKPIAWGGGFHAATAAPHFSGLYLFHMAMVDAGERLKRAAQLRKFEVVNPEGAPYHRFPPLFSINILMASTQLEVRDFDAEVPGMVARALGSAKPDHEGLYYIQEEIRPKYFFQIPERFKASV